jgi:hypothetical protein
VAALRNGGGSSATSTTGGGTSLWRSLATRVWEGHR